MYAEFSLLNSLINGEKNPPKVVGPYSWRLLL